MIKEVFITETNCITPLGFNVATNITKVLHGVSGIVLHKDRSLMQEPFYAAILNDEALHHAFSKISDKDTYSRLEKMMILALDPIVKKTKVNRDSTKTALLFATTKGNITVLKDFSKEHVEKACLHKLAHHVADFFGFKTVPIVVSNACVSGILAVSIAKRLIQSHVYDDIFIVAGDEVSEFVLSGFNSFQVMSPVPCKPYSKYRAGVSLGEAAAAVLVTATKENAKIKVIGDGAINDANHISGPSRTGEGLFKSIQSALKEAQIEPYEIDYISAHGTATLFNDEMEAITFNRLGLETTPINSLKGFYGHTLGASGLLETVMGIQFVLENKLVASLGFDELGVSQPLHIIEKNENKNSHCFLKTASGFGGCNTAVLFQKTM